MVGINGSSREIFWHMAHYKRNVSPWGTEIHTLPDGCTTACQAVKNSSGFVFLDKCTFRGAALSLSVCFVVICSSWHPSVSCLFEKCYWRGRWRGPWSSGDQKVCSWWWIHTDTSHSAGWFPSIRSRQKSYIKLSYHKFADMSFLRAKTDSEVELQDLGGNWIAKQFWLQF